MKKALLLCDSQENITKVYGEKGLEKLYSRYELLSQKAVSGEELKNANRRYAEAEYAFSTWGMPNLTEEEIGRELPKLKAVFYAAGSVQAFARPFLNRNIRVFSAWAANAIPVVEYAVSAILLANKGFFATLKEKKNREAAKEVFNTYLGNYDQRVGILGMGMIGREVARRLSTGYKLEVVYYDPFFPQEKADELGVKAVSLEELFETCSVITNHIANLPSTVGMLNYDLFRRMKPNGFFLNTGRGAQVVEDDLIRALREEPARHALLDVTWPEPPEKNSPFYKMDNVFLTPHIAGSAGNECHRMGEYMLEEAERAENGEKPLWEVSMEMLKTMA